MRIYLISLVEVFWFAQLSVRFFSLLQRRYLSLRLCDSSSLCPTRLTSLRLKRQTISLWYHRGPITDHICHRLKWSSTESTLFLKECLHFCLFATRGGWKPQRRSFSFLSCDVSWLLLVVLTSQFFHKQNFTLSVKPRIFPAKDLQIRFFSTSNILSAHNYTVLHYRANPYCVKGHRQVQTGPDMPFMKIGMITSCTCLLAGIQPQESVTDLFFPWRESNFCY